MRLAETGADGLVPVSSLGDEYFVHDERSHSLVGERTGSRWRLGAKVEVRLREATPVTGGLLFEVVSEPEPAAPSFRARSAGRGRAGRRGAAECVDTSLGPWRIGDHVGAEDAAWGPGGVGAIPHLGTKHEPPACLFVA